MNDKFFIAYYLHLALTLAGLSASEIAEVLPDFPKGEETEERPAASTRRGNSLTPFGRLVAKVALSKLLGWCSLTTLSEALGVQAGVLKANADVPEDFDEILWEQWRNASENKYRQGIRLKYTALCLDKDGIRAKAMAQILPYEELLETEQLKSLSAKKLGVRPWLRPNTKRCLSDTIRGLLYWSNTKMPGRFTLEIESAVTGAGIKAVSGVRKECGVNRFLVQRNHAAAEVLGYRDLILKVSGSQLPLADLILFWVKFTTCPELEDIDFVGEPPFLFKSEQQVGKYRGLIFPWKRADFGAFGQAQLIDVDPATRKAIEIVLTERIGYCELSTLQKAFNIPFSLFDSMREAAGVSREAWAEAEAKIEVELLSKARTKVTGAEWKDWKIAVAQIHRDEGLEDSEIAITLVTKLEAVTNHLKLPIRRKDVSTTIGWAKMTYVARARLINLVTYGHEMVRPSAVVKFYGYAMEALRLAMLQAGLSFEDWEKKREEWIRKLKSRVPTSVTSSELTASRLIRLKDLCNEDKWLPADIILHQLFPELADSNAVRKHAGLKIAYFTAEPNFFQALQRDKALEEHINEFAYLSSMTKIGDAVGVSRFFSTRAAQVVGVKTTGIADKTAAAHKKFVLSLTVVLPVEIDLDLGLRVIVYKHGRQQPSDQIVKLLGSIPGAEATKIKVLADSEISFRRSDRSPADALVALKACYLYVAKNRGLERPPTLMAAFGLNHDELSLVFSWAGFTFKSWIQLSSTSDDIVRRKLRAQPSKSPEGPSHTATATGPQPVVEVNPPAVPAGIVRDVVAVPVEAVNQTATSPTDAPSAVVRQYAEAVAHHTVYLLDRSQGFISNYQMYTYLGRKIRHDAIGRYLDTPDRVVKILRAVASPSILKGEVHPELALFLSEIFRTYPDVISVEVVSRVHKIPRADVEKLMEEAKQ